MKNAAALASKKLSCLTKGKRRRFSKCFSAGGSVNTNFEKFYELGRGLTVANMGFEFRDRNSIPIVDDGLRQVIYIVP